MPVMAVIGAGAGEDRSIAALNIALAAARDGAKVLMIDADHATHTLSNKVNGLGKSEPSRLGWLSIGSKASRAIVTANGISILPVIKGSDAKASDAIRKAIAQARATGGYDLVILDGPAMPWSACRPQADRMSPTDWSRSCRSISTSTTAWKTSSRRSAAPSASWSASSSTS